MGVNFSGEAIDLVRHWERLPADMRKQFADAIKDLAGPLPVAEPVDQAFDFKSIGVIWARNDRRPGNDVWDRVIHLKVKGYVNAN